MNREQLNGEIVALKSLLQDSDYQLIKLIENLAGCTSIFEILATFKSFLAEFGELVNSRKACREKINLIEAELEKMDAAEKEQMATQNNERQERITTCTLTRVRS